MLLGVLGQSGWIGGDRFAPEENPSDHPQVLVTFDVQWGEIVETGEVYDDTGQPKMQLLCTDRELRITISIDGDQQVMRQYVSDIDTPCLFRHSQAVPQGSELRMIVEETEVYGWKMCQISVNNHLALPNGWAISPNEAPCEVWAVAL